MECSRSGTPRAEGWGLKGVQRVSTGPKDENGYRRTGYEISEECDAHKDRRREKAGDSINARRVVIVGCPKRIRATRDRQQILM